MAQVIQEQGLESVEKRIGVDATGARFNSIIAIEGVQHRRRHRRARDEPAGQPGAISATSMVTGASADVVWKRSSATHNDYAGRPLTVLQDVYKSESDTNQRNQAIGALDAGLRLHQVQLAAGSRSLHATVLSRRQREGPGDDGGDAGCGREESSHRQAPAR